MHNDILMNKVAIGTVAEMKGGQVRQERMSKKEVRKREREKARASSQVSRAKWG